MRPDKPNDLSKVLFLDIETVPQEYSWNKLNPSSAKLFSDKTRFEQERNEKTAEEIYSEKGGILAEFGKIICIGVGSVQKSESGYSLRVTSFQDDDEAVVLRKFVELLNKHYSADDHWLCGHNGKEFDFPRTLLQKEWRCIRVLHSLQQRPNSTDSAVLGVRLYTQ